MSQDLTISLLVASVALNLGLSPVVGRVPSIFAFGAASVGALQALAASVKTKAFDKKASKFEAKDFGENDK